MNPQLILVAAGFDGHYRDCSQHSLGLLEVSE